MPRSWNREKGIWEDVSGECVICGMNHSRAFPDDFPEEWKMCCFCLNFAKTIASDSKLAVLNYFEDMNSLAIDIITKQLDKIEKHITLVK